MGIVMQADKLAMSGSSEGAVQHADPRQLLLNVPMSRFQMTALFVTLALCALDGFDVLAITFAAPALLPEFGIGKAQLGYALSAGLLGMAMGSLLFSPLADVVGRRRMLLASLVLMIAGTLWTATVHSLAGLIASRVVTGIGIGAMIGVIFPLATEYANSQRRDLAVAMMSMGYPIGGILGGLVSAALLATYGWRAIFLAASGLGVVLAIAVWTLLLDPVAMIVARPGRDGLARANAYLRRCGHPPVAALPAPPPVAKIPMASLFGPDMARDTLTITTIYFLYMIPQFFMQTWLPTLLADIGVSPARSAFYATFFSIGGVCAALFIGASSLRIGLKQLELGLLLGAAVVVAAFAWLPNRAGLLIAGAGVSGFFVMGGMIGMYAIISRTFPAEMRASGNGFVIGVGRLGSILPPILAGMLFAAGTGRVTIAALMAAPALISLLLLTAFRVRPTTTA